MKPRVGAETSQKLQANQQKTKLQWNRDGVSIMMVPGRSQSDWTRACCAPLFCMITKDPAFDCDDARQNLELKKLQGRLRHPGRLAFRRELAANTRRRTSYERALMKYADGIRINQQSAFSEVEITDLAKSVERAARTERQRCILAMLRRGLSFRTIGKFLDVSKSLVALEIDHVRSRLAG